MLFIALAFFNAAFLRDLIEVQWPISTVAAKRACAAQHGKVRSAINCTQRSCIYEAALGGRGCVAHPDSCEWHSGFFLASWDLARTRAGQPAQSHGLVVRLQLNFEETEMAFKNASAMKCMTQAQTHHRFSCTHDVFPIMIFAGDERMDNDRIMV